MMHLGRYKIIAELGRGELGVVYRATDARRKRPPVALKVLRPERVADPQAADRLQQAAELAAILKHPNLVAVRTTGFKEGQRYIAMELIDGRSLAAVLESSGPLPLERVVPILRQLADALDYVHTAGVIHGDLKPSNILIGRDDHVTVTDLGLARAAGIRSSTTGPRPYWAPELLDPASTAAGDARSDVYALGAVVYEMLAGRPPLAGQGPEAGGGALPGPVAGAIGKALAGDAGSRYATAGEFSGALAGIADASAAIPAPEAAVAPAVAIEPETASRLAPAAEPVPVAPAAGQSEPPGAPGSVPEVLSGSRLRAIPDWVWAAGAGATALFVVGVVLLGIAIAHPAAPARVAEQEPIPVDAATPDRVPEVAVVAETMTPLPAATETAPATFTPIPSPAATDTVRVALAPVVTTTPSPPATATLRATVTPRATATPRAVSVTATAVVSPTATPVPSPQASDTPQIAATTGAGDTRTFAPSGAPMVLVPAGEFQMGSADTDKSAQSDEKPQHAVRLEAFWIDQAPVTNAQYAACRNAGQCVPLSNLGSETRAKYFGDGAFDNYPVVFIPWDAARAYCAWAGKRLPTEAEWEKGARGPEGRIYPWGDAFEAQRLNSAEAGPGDTTGVGSYPSGASPYGALDMAGNVWEWVADWYDAKYYATSPRDNPAGPAAGQYRVVRGGSWYDTYPGVRSANRSSPSPATVTGNIGFRCARSP